MSEIVNHAQATASNAPTENATAKIEFEGNPNARLLLTKDALTPHSPVFVGDTIQYIIKVQNIGTAPALNVVVTDNAPVHVIFTGATTNVGIITTATPTLVVATISTLAPNQIATITITGTIV